MPGAQPQLPEPFTIERLVPMMDEAGVDRVVIVPPTLEGTRLDYAQEAVRRYPGRFAIMGRIALDDPQTATRFPSWKEQLGVVGIRLNIAGEQARWLTDGTADWFWPAAEKAGIPVMFLTDGQTVAVRTDRRASSAAALIIDHMGVASAALQTHGLATLIGQSAALARYPNVSVKLSASPLFSSRALSVPRHDRCISAGCSTRTVRDVAIGEPTLPTRSPRRPTASASPTSPRSCAFLSEEDKDWVMGRAIMARLGWA